MWYNVHSDEEDDGLDAEDTVAKKRLSDKVKQPITYHGSYLCWTSIYEVLKI